MVFEALVFLYLRPRNTHPSLEAMRPLKNCAVAKVRKIKRLDSSVKLLEHLTVPG